MKRETMSTKAIGPATLVLTMCLAVCLPNPVSGTERLTGKGEWRSLSGDGIEGKWEASLTRDGEQLRGTLNLSGSNLFRECRVVGHIDASSIVLGAIVEGERQAVFTGTLEGASVNGEWGSAFVEDEGVWYGTLKRD